MKFKGFLCAVLALILICTVSLTVFAHEGVDLVRQCSLILTMKDGETALRGGTITLYRVGLVDDNDGNYGFKPADAYVASGETFHDLQNNTEIAKRLLQYIADNKLPEVKTETVDANGNVSFTGLYPGLYLVAQYSPAPGYNKIAPFLVSLPQTEEDGYRYDVVAEPKTQPEEATKDTTPGVPDTGQLWWPAPLLVLGGLAFVVSGVMLTRRKREN